MITPIIKQTIIITSFVMVMMMIIEYINVQTRGVWINSLKRSTGGQILLSAVLGIIPGCLGAYAVVSLYTHNIISFGSLIAAMIATSGDEAFVMFSMMPGTAFQITGILFITGIIAGLAVHLFIKNKHIPTPDFQYPLHNEDSSTCSCFKKKEIPGYYKHITFHRALLLFFISLLIFLLATNSLGHHHHGKEKHYLHITLLVSMGIALFIIATVPEHFLKHHIWEHIIKNHFLQIFLWIFLVLLALHLIMEVVDIKQWIEEHQLPILVLAILVGIIPQSGPHLMFVTLFLSGHIPLSILIANSIVQDGHGTLPLLAESKKSFILVKIINMIVAAIIGGAGLLAGI